MNICWCTLHVKDLEASEKFYKDILDLKEVSRKKPDETKELLFLSDHNGMQVELLYDSTHQFVAVKNILSIGFTTPSLDIFMSKLETSGITIKRGPLLLGGVTPCVFIEDPNGLEIQIIEK